MNTTKILENGFGQWEGGGENLVNIILMTKNSLCNINNRGLFHEPKTLEKELKTFMILYEKVFNINHTE